MATVIAEGCGRTGRAQNPGSYKGQPLFGVCHSHLVTLPLARAGCQLAGECASPRQLQLACQGPQLLVCFQIAKWVLLNEAGCPHCMSGPGLWAGPSHHSSSCLVSPVCALPSHQQGLLPSSPYTLECLGPHRFPAFQD